MLCQTSAVLQLKVMWTNKYFTYPFIFLFLYISEIVSTTERGFSNPEDLYGSEFLEFAIFLKHPFQGDILKVFIRMLEVSNKRPEDISDTVNATYHSSVDWI